MSSEAPIESRKRDVKLQKDFTKIPGSVVITVLGVSEEIVATPSDYPQSVQDRLPAVAVGHKLGDAAAGRSGQDAYDAIIKVHEGLMAGDWNVRAPAAPKVSLADVAAKFANLSDEEKETAAKLMAALGINLPGM